MAILAVCVALGCGRAGGSFAERALPDGGGRPAQLLSGLPLPSPRQLLEEPGAAAPRGTSYAETDLAKDGKDYMTTPAPHNLVMLSGDSVRFLPQWSEEVGMSFDGIAFCLYHFEIPGYDRNPQIRYTWVTPPAANQGWLLLADWNSQRWDLFAAESDHRLDLPSLAPYLDALGNLFVAMLCTGTQPVTLREVRVGSQLPVAHFTATPLVGLAPLSTHLDPASSADPDGTIVTYEWDFDGDGATDETYDTLQAIDQVFDVGGNYDVTLRCTDNDGLVATESQLIGVAAPWVHTWGGADEEQLAKALADEDGYVYAVGSTGTFVEGVDALLLLKYSPAGQLLWARAFSGGVADLGQDLAHPTRGPLYVAGQTESFGAGGADVLVQKWDTDGNIVWSRTWGGPGLDRAHSICVSNDVIAVLGQTDSYGMGAADLLFLGYSPDGVLLFSLTWGGPMDDLPGGMAPELPLANPPLFAITGTTSTFGGGSTDALHIELVGDGGLIRIDTWGGAGAESGQAISCDAAGDVFITGSVNDAVTGDNVLLLGRDKRGVSIMQKSWGLDGADQGLSIALDAQGVLYVAGVSLSFGAQSDGVLLAFAPDATLILDEHWDRLDDAGQLSSVAMHPYGGLLLAGCGSGVPDGAWAGAAGTLSDITGDWFTPEAPPEEPAFFTVTEPAEVAVDITTGVEDSGAGGDDGLLMLREVPLL